MIAIKARQSLLDGFVDHPAFFQNGVGKFFSGLAPLDVTLPYVVFQRTGIETVDTFKGSRPTAYLYEFRIYVDRTSRPIEAGDGLTDADRIDEYEDLLVSSLHGNHFFVRRDAAVDTLDRVLNAIERAVAGDGSSRIVESNNADMVLQRAVDLALMPRD